MTDQETRQCGANLTEAGVHFRIWAPAHEEVSAIVYQEGRETVYPLEPEGQGYFSVVAESTGAGTRYAYRLDDDKAYPDPASRFQPLGVHGPSEVVDPRAFAWSDSDWGGVTLDEMIIYEAHVGTATSAGTFDALIDRVDELVTLGVTALELMPIANFPGARNWGYDGVNLYAPATAYGGPEGLRRLVDAAHSRGLAVILDVVYNHLGPEGNYLPIITNGHFFTDRHHTPWGDAVNYDGPKSRHVREFVIQNALYWVHEFHIDGLRLDATHTIVDDSPIHILRELTDRVHVSADRPITLIAEDERNERMVITPVDEGGLGLDAVWADDFHHQLRRLTAGDSEGYFAAYSGSTVDLAETLRKGWYFEGQGWGENNEPRGTPASGFPPSRFVHCIQNHDQVGNRPLGDRLGHEVDAAVYRAASALLLLSPYTPLIWMGQEWSASTPFLYFTDHPEELGRLVTEGRREEFKSFTHFSDPETRESIPDPQHERTFLNSKLNWGEREEPAHAGVLALYSQLLHLRREHPALKVRDRDNFAVEALGEGAIALRRSGAEGEELLLVVCFKGEIRVDLAGSAVTAPPADDRWSYLIGTEETRFGGSGAWGRLEPEGVLHLSGPGGVVLGTKDLST